jgi:hypothetical protein
MRWLPFLLALAGCGPAVTVEPKLSSIQEKLFTPSCSLASCHSREAHNAELVLEPADAYASLINADPDNPAARADGLKRVVAGDPERSLLYIKIRPGLVAAHGAEYGEPMPVGSEDGADADAVEAVRQWIADGASEG